MAVELRVDPDDDKPYTLESLKEKYARDFTTSEIEDYWLEECTAVPSDKHPSGNSGPLEEAGKAGVPEAAHGEPKCIEERPQPSRSQKRVDPEDGVSYYFEDFMTKHGGNFSEAEIIDYWFDEMAVDLPDGTMLFVSNLSKATTAEDLSRRFAAFGELALCHIHRDADKVSKGFASLQYTSVEAAEQALAVMNGAEFGGAKLKVRELLSRNRDVSVFVGAVPKEVTAEDIEKAFGVCGEVASCSVLHDSGSEERKGQARVDFIFPESVQRAVEMFHSKAPFVDNQRLVVMPWREDDCGRRVPGPSVFVAKLPLDASEQQLRGLFEGVGLVVVNSVVFKNKDTLESRGIGKVELGDVASVKAALEKLHGAELDGSSIVVREFSSQAKQADRQQAIFVSGLGSETTFEGLSAFFATAGEVESVQLFAERETGRSKGVAKVMLKDAEGFRKALRLNGAELDGRKLFVREYLPMHQAEIARLQRSTRTGTGFLIYVGNLSNDTTAEMLKTHFGSCGQIVDAQLMRNKETGLWRGTAKVAFATQEGMHRAIKEMSGTELDGRQIHVREFVVMAPGERLRFNDAGQGGRGADGAAGGAGLQQDKGPGIFVAGLDTETTDEALRACFSEFGRVTEAFVLKSRETGMSRGIGRVFFAEESSQRKVLEQPYQVELDGRRLFIRPHGQPSSRVPSFPVFLGAVPQSATAQALQGHFESEFGEVTGLHLFLDREGKPRGIAKLDFATAEAQQLALSRHHVEIDGRTVYVREFGSAAAGAKAGHESFGVNVSGLGPETSVEALLGLFRKYGEVRDCRIFASRGTAKVDFAAEEARRRAVRELHGADLDGSAISVREATSSSPAASWSPECAAEASRPQGARLAGYAVFVTGCSLDTTEDMLREHFRPCGEASDCRFMPLREERGWKSARVEFRTKTEQEAAIKELTGSSLDSRSITVREFVQAGAPPEAPWTTALVTGLPHDCTSDQLWSHVERALIHQSKRADPPEQTCSSVRNVRLLRDKETGSSRGIAKVELATQEALRKAIEVLDDSELDGRRISVRAASSDVDKATGALPRDASDAAFPFRSAGSRGHAAASAPGTAVRNAVFVGGLCLDTSVESLRRHFEDAGEIRTIRLILDRITGRPRGAAFIEFTDEEGQRVAIEEWDRTELDGSTISVRAFETRQPTPSASSRAPPQTPPRAREADPSEASPFSGSPADGASPAEGSEARAWTHGAARAAEDPERKVDPEDGKVYTYEELRRRAKGEGFSDQEILDYWRYDCEPVKHPARTVESSSISNGADSVAPAQRAEPEKRVDPEDGKAYTYEELHRRARGEGFTDQEILDYWLDECTLVECPAPAAGSPAPVPAPAIPAPAPAAPGQPEARPVPAEAPYAVETPRRAAAEAPAPCAAGLDGAGALKDMSLKEWVDALDSQWLRLLPSGRRPANGVRDCLGVLEEQFDSVEQIMKLYLRRGGGPDGSNVLDDGFFEDVGISKIGQRRVVNKWIAANT